MNMDILTFISKILDSVAWPTAIVFIVILLRDKIGIVLTEYQNLKVKYKDIEVNLNKTMESVERKVEIAAKEENISLEIIESPKLMKLAKYSPRAAILESWIEFEELLYSLLEKVGYSKERPGGVRGKIIRRPLKEVEDILKDKGALNDRLASLILEIKHVRNSAVHATDSDFTFHSVERFVQSVNEIRFLIEKSANRVAGGF